MKKKIIVATDFSNGARNAAYYGADLASAIGADLLVLHVVLLPESFYNIPLYLEELNKKEAEGGLKKLKDEILSRSSGKLKIDVELRVGSFFSELVEVCTDANPYAVIMGSQGTSATDRFFFGSHTVQAIRNLLWPLIAVPPAAKFSGYKKICLACDLKEVVDYTPIGVIKNIVNDFHPELHVVNAEKQKNPSDEQVFESGLLQELLLPMKPEYHFITDTKIDESILNFVESKKMDLLIVVPKQHGFLKMLTQKSVSKQLILKSKVAILALHSMV